MRTARSHDKFKKLIVVSFGDPASTGGAAVWWWMFVVRRFGQGAGGLMAIGKSRAKIYVETDTKTTFADVEEAKAELREVVEFLKDPKGYGRLGARIPKGGGLTGSSAREIRASRAADVVEVPRLLARAVGLRLPIEKLGVNAVLLNQVIDTVLAFAAALVALDAEDLELAD